METESQTRIPGSRLASARGISTSWVVPCKVWPTCGISTTFSTVWALEHMILRITQRPPPLNASRENLTPIIAYTPLPPKLLISIFHPLTRKRDITMKLNPCFMSSKAKGTPAGLRQLSQHGCPTGKLSNSYNHIVTKYALLCFVIVRVYLSSCSLWKTYRLHKS